MSAAKKKRSAPRSAPKTPRRRDAVALLKADHALVSSLFKSVEGTRATAKKKALVAQICQELTIHATVEEEIFYPAFQQALRDDELVPEAHVEHESLKNLIAQLEDAEPGDEMYDARVKVLSEYVKHHVKEEHSEMFPKAKKSSKLDLQELGERMLARKEELLAELA